MRWRIVSALLLAAFLPLVLASFGSWIVFGRLVEQNSIDRMRIIAHSHAKAIEADLTGNRNLLQLTAEAYDLGTLDDSEQLRTLLENLNRASDGGFVDLGVIDDQGAHLAYVGPYDLQNKNYRDADWFREVSVLGAYISDVFLGFRQVPHCIIAVTAVKGGRLYILRATINSERFSRFVANVPLGTGVSAYIVNRQGLYQTTPADGSVLDESPLKDLSDRGEGLEEQININGADIARVSTWINDNRWLLVFEQNLEAVRAPVNQAIAAGASFVFLAILLLVLTTFFATWHLTKRIDKANAERDEMTQAFVRSARLASIGELATGLAHEINNPLAIISAEQTNISDLVETLGNNASTREEVLGSIERSKAQVQRCASITRKMLQFGRQKETNITPTDLGSTLSDIESFLHKRAGVQNIAIECSIDPHLPHVLVDPIELEQVVVNLINNSFDALPNGGTVTLRAYEEKDWVHLEVTDDGGGIPETHIGHVFEPFYTTKEVGKGTGLGLSVCYGIVKSWGGNIDIESEVGKGTTIHMLLPRQVADTTNQMVQTGGQK